MKFTRKHSVDQRLDQMTEKHVIVGIDIAKDKHAARMTNFRGRTLTPRHYAFTNDAHGFEQLLQWLNQAMQKHCLSTAIVGMEPTGHYWFNLAHWLLERGIKVVLVNPALTRRHKEDRDNSPAKNDPKDALVIADVVTRGYYTEYTPQDERFGRLKSAVLHRDMLVRNQTQTGNRIVRWIDLYFPEYSTVFKNWDGVRSLATLKSLQLPKELRRWSVDDFIRHWGEQGLQRPGGVSGRKRAAELIQAASGSIGDCRAPEEAILTLSHLLEMYELGKRQIEAVDQRLEELLRDLPQAEQLASLGSGMGPTVQAALLGLAGDLSSYRHGNQLLNRAGLSLATQRSGTYKGQVKLTKRGDSLLRKVLFLAVLCLVKDHPEFKTCHERNQAQGMARKKSIICLIGKLARMLVAMANKGERYRPNLESNAA
ncbi:IS110 family transposase [Paenibacillus sp. FSL W8-1187]|uniref:IS110 family transposase n=1 Tax=unclassified Paenibacillus TaxID=185978 RepID=UPI00129B4200|nr:IS110 family transposase [Paenibacillus sp. B01]QGG55189.1 IS110 family transposase [Paenibacillus sp. B01]QGG58026.1 IS110 family transposase [Paenibacillus sp. B01]